MKINDYPSNLSTNTTTSQGTGWVFRTVWWWRQSEGTWRSLRWCLPNLSNVRAWNNWNEASCKFAMKHPEVKEHYSRFHACLPKWKSLAFTLSEHEVNASLYIHTVRLPCPHPPNWGSSTCLHIARFPSQEGFQVLTPVFVVLFHDPP